MILRIMVDGDVELLGTPKCSLEQAGFFCVGLYTAFHIHH